MTYKQIKKLKLLLVMLLTIFIFTQQFRLILNTRNRLSIIQNAREEGQFLKNKSKTEEKAKLALIPIEKSPLLSENTRLFTQASDYNEEKQTISASKDELRLLEQLIREKGLIERGKEFFFILKTSLKYRLFNQANKLANFRQNLVWLLEGNLSTRGATLAQGFLFAELSGASQELYQSFKVIGILHLIAASSANVYLMLAFFKPILFFLEKSFNKRLKFAASLAITWAYFFLLIGKFSLVEAGASIFRSVLMISLQLMASLLFFRPYSSQFSLFLVGFLLLLINPFYLVSLGFQFSFLASFALLFIWPVIRKKLPVASKNPILASLLLSLTVQLVLSPVFIFCFSSVNLLGIAANVVLAPLVGLLSASYLYLLLIAAVSPFLAACLAILIEKVTDIFFYLLDLFNQFPLKSIEIYQHKNLIGAFFLLLNLFVLALIIRHKNQLRKKYKYKTLSKWGNYR